MKSLLIGLVLLVSFSWSENVSLSYRGGVYHTPVTLNNSVRLEFVVDSGAATVYIPSDVFRTLIRTGTVSESDIIRTDKAQTATGEVVDTLVVNIRNLKIGNKILHNVETSVGGTEASLLLGQSALQQLEPWSINTRKKILTIGPSNTQSTYSSHQNNSYSGTISRKEIASFIDDYISRGNSRDLKGIMALYNKNVDYFRAGVVSKNYIYKDKVKYYKKWPSMQAKFLHIDSIKNVSGYPNQKIVKYSIDFDVYNYSTKKGISGQAINTILIEKDNGHIKIISDKQKVLKKQKY